MEFLLVGRFQYFDNLNRIYFPYNNSNRKPIIKLLKYQQV